MYRITECGVYNYSNRLYLIDNNLEVADGDTCLEFLNLENIIIDGQGHSISTSDGFATAIIGINL